MKKSAAILLAGIYVMASFGIAINSFYCCGKLKAVTISLVEQQDAKCAGNGNSSCCNIRHQILKVQDSHTGSTAFFHFSDLWALNPRPVFENETPFFVKDLTYGAHADYAPPPIASCPLYTFHCDYRI
jgi:hypothetical protein